MFECDTWSPTLRDEHRVRVLEHKMLRRILGPKRDEVQGSRENYIASSLMFCTADPLF